MTTPQDSFFRDRGEVGEGPIARDGERLDPLGLTNTLDTLQQSARMEALMLIVDAQTLLDELGQETTVSFDENAKRILLDGEEGDITPEPGAIQTETIITTENSADVNVSGSRYFLRPARFAPNSETGEPSEFGDDIFFLKDETPDFRDIRVRNPFLIKAEVGDMPGEVPGIEIRGDFGLEKNNPEAIELLRERLNTIVDLEGDRAQAIRDRIEREEQDALRAEQQRVDDEQRASERRIAEARAAQRSKLDTLGSIASRVGSAAKEFAPPVLAVAGVLSVFVALGKAIYDENTDFDCRDGCEVGIYYTENNGPRLPEEATIIAIGESGSPEPLFEVTQDPLYSPLVVPEVGDQQDRDDSTFGPDADGGLTRTEPANIDFLVQVVLDDPERTDDLDGDGENDAMCEVTYVDFAEETDEIQAAIASTEAFRQDEFILFVLDDQVKVCWTGEEQAFDDNPSVFFNRIGEPLVPVSNRDIRPPEYIDEQ